MAVQSGARGGSVLNDVNPVIYNGLIAPIEGMDSLPVTHMALDAGDFGNAAGKVAAVTFGAGIDVGHGSGFVSGRQPAGHVRPAAVGGKGTLGILIPTADKRESNEHGQPYSQDDRSYR